MASCSIGVTVMSYKHFHISFMSLSLMVLLTCLVPYDCSTMIMKMSLVVRKPDLQGFRPGLTQTRLYSYRKWLEA